MPKSTRSGQKLDDYCHIFLCSVGKKVKEKWDKKMKNEPI